MGASLRDRVLMLRTKPLFGVFALRVSPDLRGAAFCVSAGSVAAVRKDALRYGLRFKRLRPQPFGTAQVKNVSGAGTSRAARWSYRTAGLPLRTVRDSKARRPDYNASGCRIPSATYFEALDVLPSL